MLNNYFDIDQKMAKPPEFWLQRLFDYDADLVVFPSIQVPFAYCLARRARLTGGMNDKILGGGATPDTKFCLQHKLLPVTIIYRHSTASWSIDNIIGDLQSRDIWKHGGAEKVSDMQDANDDAERAKIKQNIRDDMYNRSGDAWRSYQARTGQRSKLEYGHRTRKTEASITIPSL